jgi:hypothetical protein
VSKQLDLYADRLMTALKCIAIPFRNEHQMQDISAEPVARLIVDYLSCLYGQREPKAWIRLMNQLIPFANDEIVSSAQLDFQRFLTSQRKSVANSNLFEEPYSGWWEHVRNFLSKVGIETLVALSPDYESRARLKEVIRDTKALIEEFLILEPDFPKALERFSEDQAVRILTIHKSKGLEFDSVIILGVEEQTFWGEPEAERSAFFVGVSRAKQRLVLSVSNLRETPPSNPFRWQEQRTPHAEFIDYSVPFVS